MEVINNSIYEQASDYAKKHGLSLTTVVENFFLSFSRNDNTTIEREVPDIVLSLLGAGSPIDEDDINARKAYHKFSLWK